MPLIQEHQLTDAGREARRRNGRQSHGAATSAGKERSRAAHLRHGIYSKERDQALRALGEDPADFAALIEGSHQQWRPVNSQQSRMVERLALLQWRMDRAARIQDSVAAEHVSKVAADRHKKTLDLKNHYLDMSGFLKLLLYHAPRSDFFVAPASIVQFHKIFGSEMHSRLEQILDLLHALREPENPLPAPSSLPPQVATDAEWENFRDLEEEDEVDLLQPDDTPVAEGEERAELREQLIYLARQEVESLQSVWDPFFEKYARPLTGPERDCAVPEVQPRLERLRREEESCVRQFCRLSTLLMKMQDREREPLKSPVPASGIEPPADETAATAVRAAAAGGEHFMESAAAPAAASGHDPGALPVGAREPSGNCVESATGATESAVGMAPRPNETQQKVAFAGVACASTQVHPEMLLKRQQAKK
jgi:hypothetical protein